MRWEFGSCGPQISSDSQIPDILWLTDLMCLWGVVKIVTRGKIVRTNFGINNINNFIKWVVETVSLKIQFEQIEENGDSLSQSLWTLFLTGFDYWIIYNTMKHFVSQDLCFSVEVYIVPDFSNNRLESDQFTQFPYFSFITGLCQKYLHITSTPHWTIRHHYISPEIIHVPPLTIVQEITIILPF